MVKKVLLVLAVLVAAFVVVVATRPSAYRYQRAATIAAPPALVQAQVADFHRWAAWSPWEHLDPAMKKTFAGPAQGVGAAYHWAGNDKVGEGRMTITGVTPGGVEIKLEFLKPWTQTSLTTFTFAPEGPGTRVSWAMSGENGFTAKAMTLFMDMDGMIGKDFDEGLAKLKAVAEGEARAAATAAAPATAAPAR
ncbi:MAG TPA: SRPBCC family protein [Anaeromyxobacteraceae bacterium]|jgi:hypothetical protein